MLLILLGPPGAGKGTQAEQLVRRYKLNHISTGEILRSAIKQNTELGRRAGRYLQEGRLVPDDIVVGIVKEKLWELINTEGVLLDGFPRTLEQAEALDAVLSELSLSIDLVINIAVDEDALLARLTGRRGCKECGATYHIHFNPPEVRNICNECGSELHQRSDDTPETVKERLKVYNTQTAPLISYYREQGILVSINGNQPIDKVFDEIRKNIDSRRQAAR